jgi:hypothetical protein
VIICALGGSFSFQTDDQKYKFIKEEDGIALYYRWIDTPAEREVRELKAQFKLASSPENILTVIRNESTALQWMKGVSQFLKVGISTENMWYAYILYDIPWPLSNQDCIIQHTLFKDHAGKTYYISMKGVPKYIPEKEGVVRIQHLQGTWKITAINKNESNIEYTIYTTQAPKFPRWITDPIIQENLINTMLSLRKLVEN